MRTELLPPGVNPIAVNKYIKCFNASASSSESLNLVVARIMKLLKSYNNDHVNILMYCLYPVVI